MTTNPDPVGEDGTVALSEYERLRGATDAIHRGLLHHAATLEAEVRRLQGWVSRLTNGDELLCEELCPVLCAGPCQGRDFDAVERPFSRCPNCGLNTGRRQLNRVLCDDRWHDEDQAFWAANPTAKVKNSDGPRV